MAAQRRQHIMPPTMRAMKLEPARRRPEGPSALVSPMALVSVEVPDPVPGPGRGPGAGKSMRVLPPRPAGHERLAPKGRQARGHSWPRVFRDRPAGRRKCGVGKGGRPGCRAFDQRLRPLRPVPSKAESTVAVTVKAWATVVTAALLNTPQCPSSA